MLLHPLILFPLVGVGGCKAVLHGDDMVETCRTYEIICDDILERMKLSQDIMKSKGLWKEDITFEEWLNFMGSQMFVTPESEK